MITLFTHTDWPDWFASMQSPEKWDRTDALVFADWCDERDEPPVAEYVRVQCHHAGSPNDTIAVTPDNPEWSRLPCPECGGNGNKASGPLDNLCHGTGDLLIQSGDAWSARPLTRWPYTPFVRAVGLRMEEIARQVVTAENVRQEDGWEWMGDGSAMRWEPTPLARALVAGLPTLRQLRVTGADPHWNGAVYAWYRQTRVRPNLSLPSSAVLPDPIFDAIPNAGAEVIGRLKGELTPDAAHDALADGSYQWVSGFIPDQRPHSRLNAS